MAESHRTMTIAYTAAHDGGMTLDEIDDRIQKMRAAGIPGDAIPRVDVRGSKNAPTIGAFVASDRADDDA